MTTIIADIETDGLTATTVFCLSTLDYDTKEVRNFSDWDKDCEDLHLGLALLKEADTVVFHNGIGYDLYWLEKLCSLYIPVEKVADTLIWSRLLYRNRKSYSLASFGRDFRFPKGEFSDFGAYSKDMLAYCQQDVAITARLYDRILADKKDELDPIALLEHRFNTIITDMLNGGVKFDGKEAERFKAQLSKKLDRYTDWFQKVFPPYEVERVSEKTGKPLKPKVVEFNPNSNIQVAEKLVRHCRYSSRRRTPTGKLKMDDVAFKAAKHPLGNVFLTYSRIAKIHTQLAGDRGFMSAVRDGKIHHSINSMGTATHRCAHFKPNLAQTDKKEKRMRKLFLPDEGDVMVGCDASELELRLLAHYLHGYDKGDLVEKITKGDKAIGTDAHSATARLFGISRDAAKTLIYAYIYGAGGVKLSLITREGGSQITSPAAINKTISESYGGLLRLTALAKATTKRRGYIYSIGGRPIYPEKEHACLNYLIQSSGADIMKKSLEVFHYQLGVERGLVEPKTFKPVGFRYLLNIHDEQQFSVRPDLAELVGQTFVDSIVEAGRQFKSRCVMGGEYQIGNNWAETH